MYLTSYRREHEYVRALEERSFNAWPAFHTVLVNGWILRFTDGYTKRANSANAFIPSGEFSQTRSIVETLYAEQGQAAIFRLTPLAGDEPDQILEDAGYKRCDETYVWTMELSQQQRFIQRDPGVTIISAPTVAWCDGFATFNNISSMHRDTHDRMLSIIQLPSAFAVLEDQAVPVGYGLAVVERGMVGLFDIVTDPTQRLRGYGRRLVSALLGWGMKQGASTAYLQVVSTNSAAMALYRQMGFLDVYRYHYRIAS